MIGLFFSKLPILVFLLISSCRPQGINDGVSDLQSKKDQRIANGSQNFPTFDAYMIWDADNGLEGTKGVFDYPSKYDSPIVPTGTPADGVFYDSKRYWEGTDRHVDDWDGWRGKPTGSVRIVDNELKYPEKNGRKLKLKFSEITSDEKI